MRLKRETVLGVFVTLLSAMTFGTFAVWVEFAYLYLEPWELLSVQSLLASGLLLVLVRLKRIKVLSLPKTLLRELVLLGLVGSMLAATCFTWSVKFLPPAIVTILFYSYPAMVILGSFFWLKTPVNRYHWLAVALTFVGAYLSAGSLEDTSFSLLGIILALGAALCTAFYNLQGERVLSSVSPLTAMIVSQFASTLGFLVIAPPTYLWSGGLPLEGVLITLGATVTASLIPFFLLLKGISLIGAGPASVVSTFELPTVAVLSYLFLGHTLSLRQILGLLLVVIAIVVIHIGAGHLEQPSPKEKNFSPPSRN
ncbi:MAG: EamA family transporter [Firmicutes bacterium]|nr:EamA family transporter [Bacillota bacterium]